MDPIKTSLSRVFITEGGARVDRAPAYQSCMRAGGLSQDFGDVTDIECPSAERFGEFEKVGETQGQTGRATCTLTGRFALDVASTLLRLAKKRCTTDLHLLFGKCKNPTELNKFEKVIIVTDARYINYTTDDLGALSSEEDNPVNESADVSGREILELLQTSYAERGGSVITNELVDVIICDVQSCGDCEDESDGCEKIYAVSISAGGSAGTPADLVFSLDGGANFYAHDIDSLVTGNNPTGIACLGDYLVVVADNDSLHYVDKDDVKVGADHTWAMVTTGFVANKGGKDISSTGTIAFIVGEGGYVYYTTDPTAGVVVADAGVATTDDLNAVQALTDDFAVAVGNNGAILKTVNGTTWTKLTSPVVAGIHFNCIAVKSTTEWIIGASNGNAYYTVDGGVNFTALTFNGSGSGQVDDIAFSNDLCGFMSHRTTTPRGRILRTIDGGHSWFVEPEYGSLPLADRFNALAACEYKPNMVVAVGLADNAADGIAVVGT
jgi:photosystem II stability/assembly factor-like uncharacterized protein